MTLKYKIIIGVVALAVSFAVGRYSVQSPTIKTVEVAKEDKNTQTDKNDHKTTTITKKPNGEEVTTITEDTNTITKQKDDTNINIEQTITPPKTNTLNVSALAGFGIISSFKPVYGISISKQLIGPVTTGLFGMTDGTIGVSIGLNF